mmetsp:Transcript_45253/g.96678  ORF Transcript_45253/g.96678 Transcript_45253/m.96678 type:complete len:128 (-) Transcript_45253:175-558(-)
MGRRAISVEELKEHSTGKDCWIAVHGLVYDVTEFLSRHPGGGEVIVELAGQDSTEAFEDIAHSDASREEADEFIVGWLEGHEDMKEAMTKRIAEVSASEGGSGQTRAVLLAAGVFAAAAVAFFFARR